MAQIADEHQVARQAIEALRVALGERLSAVVLFGSRARGDATPESDWDLLVIADGLPEHPFDRHVLINSLLPPNPGGGISVLARTPEEFEFRLSSLYLDIALDGKVLYDPRGYAAERLAAIRRAMDEAGLYREGSEAGDIWRWKNQPAGRWVLRVSE
jgi:predicted nucleotidyltransferase